MLKYYIQKVKDIDPYESNYTFIHAACFGNEI
jgi:hypothetical protein